MAPKSGGNAGVNNPAMTKRRRFNANITPAGHAGCIIARQSKIDKEKHQKNPTAVVRYVSKARGMFHVVDANT